MIKKIKTIILIVIALTAIGFSFNNFAYAASSACQQGDANACINDSKISPFMKLAKTVINILSGAVLLIATIMIIIAGITYTTSSGDPAKVTKAKTTIINVVMGVAAYFFLWAFLQWLIPGGVFNG